MSQAHNSQSRKLAAIMFTDIVGYTPLMAENEVKALNILNKQRDLIQPIIESFHGEWLKEIGDGTLSSFPSAVDAVRCAIEIQSTLQQEPEISLRIGIHIGDVVVDGGDVLGDGVNIASRIESLADPGGIYLSERVYDDIRNKPDIPIIEIGLRKLKGVDRSVKIYRVRQDNGTELGTQPVRQGKKSMSLKWFIIAATILVTVSIAMYIFTSLSSSDESPKNKRISSLAVLPLDNLMNDKTEEYFVDGMHDALLTELSRIGAIRVISRTSVLGYKNNPKSIQDIAKELGVDAIIEGSVLRVDNQVRINLQLIQVYPEKHIWAEAFDRDLLDILSLHREVAQQVADQIRITLNPLEKDYFSKPIQVNPAAQILYLKGLSLSNEGMALEAETHFKEAIQIDPVFAPAYAKLAKVYYFYKVFGSPSERIPKAEAAAKMTLSLQSDHIEALQILALIEMSQHWNWDEAKRYIDKALITHPGNHYSHEIYSQYLSAMGETGESVKESEIASSINPLDKYTIMNLARAYYRNGQNSQAIEQYEIYQMLAPGNKIISLLVGLAYAESKEFDKAIENFVHYAGNDTLFSRQLVETYEERGYNEALKMWAEYWEPLSDTPRIRAISVALIYAKAGVVDKAIEYLEKAYERRETPLIFIKSEPQFAPIRTDPRYLNIVKKMGLN